MGVSQPNASQGLGFESPGELFCRLLLVVFVPALFIVFASTRTTTHAVSTSDGSLISLSMGVGSCRRRLILADVRVRIQTRGESSNHLGFWSVIIFHTDQHTAKKSFSEFASGGNIFSSSTSSSVESVLLPSDAPLIRPRRDISRQNVLSLVIYFLGCGENR